MNLFYALLLPDNVRNWLAARADEWREMIPPETKLRWYGRDDYHVTLKFLGDLPAAREPEFIAAADTAATARAPFSVRLGPSGNFSDRAHQPSVLWAGLGRTTALAELANTLDRAAAQRRIAPDRRPYHPHITLARCRSCGPFPSPVIAEHLFPSFTATSFALMRTASHRQWTERRYNIVQAFPLLGEAVAQASTRKPAPDAGDKEISFG